MHRRDLGAAGDGGLGLELRADCERCFGLCCVAPAFAASADFAIDKPAGQPCPHLQASFSCGIHDRLRPAGFQGCAVFECYGAGQHVAQVTFGGRDWRQAPETAKQMFAAFGVMRQLHELLWHLTAALAMPRAEPLHGELAVALAATQRLTALNGDELAMLDVAAHRHGVNALLQRAGALVRAGLGYRAVDRNGADLIGADLHAADLRGANLRGARLIGANLRGADLSAADVTGADFRAADVSGAALSESLFLTQSQLDAANGDRATTVPASHARPAHWTP